MKVLEFTLSGETAVFKKPEVNTYLYFTYGNIHKVALLGIFGAILGYQGYNNQKDLVFPEFYERLKNLKLSVVPNNNGFIPKKVQVFNNSVGYASRELGGNLIVKEQWLEKPSWDIYVKLQDEESERLADSIINNKSIYTPYLGKNDHYADISHSEIIENCVEAYEIQRLDSLCLREYVDFLEIEEDPFEIEEDSFKSFKYEEKLPIALEEKSNSYILKSFVFSNINVSLKEGTKAYRVGNRNIVFY